MKETGVIMTGVHPKLILDGRKTQTRRVIKPQPIQDGRYLKIDNTYGRLFRWKGKQYNSLGLVYYGCPYGQVGDRIWVKENWATSRRLDRFSPSYIGNAGTVALWYMTEDNQVENPAEVRGKWRPSIFMPRWASRITLEITEVRVERLQEITQGEIRREGIKLSRGEALWATREENRIRFAHLWDSLNAKRGYPWESNPWVWVISFGRIGK